MTATDDGRSVRGPVLDFGNMLTGALAEFGIDPARLNDDLARRFHRAYTKLEARRISGELGFLDLPDDKALALATSEAAARHRSDISTLVVLGIGGSALGAATLRDALLPSGWNEVDADGRKQRPRLLIVDNPDPDTVSALLARLDLCHTLFNVVSKSGSTAETAALLLLVWQMLKEEIGEDGLAERIFVTTEEGSAGATGADANPIGPLRQLANDFSLPTLPIPKNVGGRFSVLSPAGLFPAALTGIDTDAVLRGAAKMTRRCLNPVLIDNPAGVLATLLFVADTELVAKIVAFMPYADRLRTLAAWFQQLWAESLGKASGAGESGPTPLPALGATDQHSLLQLFMEGPRDKVVLFLGRSTTDSDLKIPSLFTDRPAFSYLGGNTLHGLLESERRATAEALRRAGRLNMTVTVDTIDADTMGGLIMLFQIAVVYAGALYGVNPLDQPGVELGKTLTYGIMKRPGYDPPDIPRADPRWQV